MICRIGPKSNAPLLSIPLESMHVEQVFLPLSGTSLIFSCRDSHVFDQPSRYFPSKGEGAVDEDPLTVLVVDDDESVRRAMKRLLMSNGYQVLTFESAEDFLRSGLMWDRACLLLDIRLPGISGLDLQAKLAASGMKCPVIFMTAHDDSQWLEMAREAGAIAFLRKPFGERSLLNALALICGKGEGAEAVHH